MKRMAVKVTEDMHLVPGNTLLCPWIFTGAWGEKPRRG